MVNKQLINSFIQQNTHESWFDLLSNIESLHKAIWDVVSLSKKTSIEPKLNDMLNAFKYCSLDKLKVIMLSQDPYPQKDVATGLAFANVDSIKSPSLRIINEELTRTHGELDDSSLITWAQQGILLLNSSLTIKTGKIGSHYQYWEQFIIDLVKQLSQQDYIWVLMGSRAQSFQFCVNKGVIIKTKHPASDVYNDGKGFRGSNVFVRIDEELEKRGLDIKWTNKVKELV